MTSSCRWLVLVTAIYIILTIVCDVDATLSMSDKKSKRPKKMKAKKESTGNVLSRGLVRPDHTAMDIVREHSRYSALEKEVRHFNGAVLAYVTPWNSKGYDIAKTFHRKFTLVSPVWLQVTPKPDKGFVMKGGHDIDSGWARQVVKDSKTSLVPRVLFDQWTMADYQNMFGNEAVMGKCAKVITAFIKKHGFGGVTIELWSQLPATLHADMTHFLIDLSDMLHKANKIIVLVVPPSGLSPSEGSPAFTKGNFEELKDSIDYFSVMTYDYHAQTGKAGPSSPIPWVEKTIKDICPLGNQKDRSKILIGINFYGMRFGESSAAKPVLGNEFTSMLEAHSPQARWLDKEAEHVYSFKDVKSGESTFVFYPSLLFLKSRLDLARDLGTGIAIWEIGQGLDYFYDLL